MLTYLEITSVAAIGPLSVLWTLTILLLELGMSALPENPSIITIAPIIVGIVYVFLHFLLYYVAVRKRRF
jgi:uncharacterized metal-binding protein